MARATFVKKARKDNAVCKKGESYWWFKFAYQAKRLSKERPKPSQLTQSEFLSQLYELQEQRDDVCSTFRSDEDHDDFKSNIEDIAQQLEDLGSECQDKHDNMPDQLQDGDIGQLLEERANRCEEMSGELCDAANGCDDLDALSADEKVQIDCPHCGDESDFPPEFRGAHNCTECEKDYKVTDEMVQKVLDDRRTERESKIEEIVSAVEEVDLDCE